MLCADLVKIEWQERAGAPDGRGLVSPRTVVANLEDISASGACLQIDTDIPPQTVVTIRHENGDFQGRVKYCVFKEIGYFLGLEFDAGYRWNARQFKPMHLLDPRRLGPRPQEAIADPVTTH
jgi:hypothetical protein